MLVLYGHSLVFLPAALYISFQHKHQTIRDHLALMQVLDVDRLLCVNMTHLATDFVPKIDVFHHLYY